MVGKLSLVALSSVLGYSVAQQSDYPGVIATGTMGKTNPSEPTLGTEVDDKSEARLLSVNNIDDFCIYGPKDAEKPIGDTEAEQVAWCTQPRNNARLIPEGTFTGLHFIKSPYYIQLQGWGDLTKIGLKDGDYGGELDPHGAKGDGNPIGGNVTSNITGEDVSYAEWMQFISFEQFCLRVCTAGDDTWDAATMCEHKLDIMGCGFVMPGDYSNKDVFQTCDADAALPPGVYPDGDGYSTFAQRYTGTLTEDGSSQVYTVGDTATPSSPAFTPSSSNCETQSTINNYVTTETPEPTENSNSENNSGAWKSSALGVLASFSVAAISAFAIFN